MTKAYEVLVVGGGPAGLATGIVLSRLGRSVAVFEKGHYNRPRAGETFGPDLKAHLQALGAWEDFAATQPVPFRGVASCWGSSLLAERSSIFHPLGEGWHVERTQFDRVLADTATRSGVVVRQGAAIRSLEWSDGIWRARTAAGEEASGLYLVDASGRGAAATLGHIPGRQWVRMDRQVAVLGTMAPPSNPVEPVLLLEAMEEGWWYSVPQPGGTLLIVLITDADLLPVRGASGLTEHFLKRLGQSVHTVARSAGAKLSAPVWIARSDSGLLTPDRGPGWRAVGDAAMACDPLAGDGVARALGTALDAAPEIHAAMAAGDSMLASRNGMRERFLDYLDVRARYYEVEGRWPDSPFWARRRPIAWREAPIFLDPGALLRWNGTASRRDLIAPAEALIPPGALVELRHQLQTPQPAHQALGFLRSASPASDRQLLVGIQLLVHLGCLAVNPCEK